MLLDHRILKSNSIIEVRVAHDWQSIVIFIEATGDHGHIVIVGNKLGPPDDFGQNWFQRLTQTHHLEFSSPFNALESL